MATLVWIVAAVTASALAGWNVVVSRRLWRSPMYERSQRIAQGVLIWLVPGSAFFVNWLLQGMPQADQLNPNANDGCTDYSGALIDASRNHFDER